MLEAVTLREIQRIFEVTDRLGIHREQLVIPLAPRHPGRVRRMPNGKIEIVVEKDGDFEAWVAGLERELRTVMGQRAAAVPTARGDRSRGRTGRTKRSAPGAP